MDILLLNTKILASLLLIYLSFGMVGARFAKAMGLNDTDPSLNPLYGWAITIVLMLCLASWMNGGGMIGFLLILCVAGWLILSSHASIMKTVPITFFFGIGVFFPLLYALCTHPVQEWDDLSHWLPNAHYLFQYGRFPAVDGPVAYSAWPGYPYGYTMLIAALGWIMGNFVEMAGPLFNIMLIIILASFLSAQIDKTVQSHWHTLRRFSIICIALTLLNPGLDVMLLFSAYAEYATAIMLAFLLYTGWQLSNNPQRGTIMCFALLAIIFVQIKQANVFLLALVIGSVWITSANKIRLLKPLFLAVLPALLAHGAWEFYKSQHLPGLAFTFKSFQDWQWHLLPPLLNAMGIVVREKIMYFGLLFTLIIWSVSKKKDPLRQLGLSFALITIGHFAFLTLAYIGSRFSEWEITTAASFFRYMSQLQMAAMMIVILKAADMLRTHHPRHEPALRILGSALVFIIPITGSAVLSLDLLKKPDPSMQITRDYAKDVFKKLPPQSKVGLIGTRTNGLENTMIRFQWCLMANPQHQPELTGYVTQYTGETTVDAIKRFAERYDAVMVAPHDTLAMQAFGESENASWVSFVRDGNTWSNVK